MSDPDHVESLAAPSRVGQVLQAGGNFIRQAQRYGTHTGTLLGQRRHKYLTACWLDKGTLCSLCPVVGAFR
jgi:hypothetical protein